MNLLISKVKVYNFFLFCKMKGEDIFKYFKGEVIL